MDQEDNILNLETKPLQAVIIAFVESFATSRRLRSVAERAAGQGVLLICADSGGEAALAWGLRPDWLVGDMDSISPATLAALRAMPGVRVLEAPAHKDETDLELALETALAAGARDILILGGLGGRLDHTLGNLYLLAAPALVEHGASARLLGEDQEIHLLRGPGRLDLAGQPGQLVSLLPLSPAADGIRTAGLYYPLRSETLRLGPSRGISNRLTGETASIELDDGLLLVIHSLA